MGWFDQTLIILNEEQERNHFLASFHMNLASLNLKLDIGDDDFICYNDTRSGEEKDCENLSERMNSEDVLKLLSEWSGLGILSYRHPNFSHCVTIDYLTWNDNQVQALVIGFNGKEVGFGSKEEKSLELIHQISELVAFKCVVGNIYDDVSIDFNRDLSDILEYIRQTKFNRIDKQNNTTNTI